MNKPIEIGGTRNAITSQFQKKYEPQRTIPAAKGKNIQLRKGEIVQGKILKIYSQKEAEVRLPIGDLKAEFSGRLKPGDILFFKVDSISPSLILKIYAVSQIIAGKELENKEILRILDLPDEDIFLQILQRFKSKSAVISKINLINIYNNFKAIAAKSYENISFSDLLKILFFFDDYSIELNSPAFDKLKGSVLGAKFLSLQIEKLIDFLKTLPKIKAIENIFTFFQKLESFPISQKILFFHSGLEGANFYNLLSELLHKGPLHASDEAALRNIVEPLLNAIEGQTILNLYATLNYTPFFFLIPYRDRQKKWKYFQLILRKRKSKKRAKGSLFDYQISLNSEFSDILDIEDEDFDDLLSSNAFSDYAEFSQALNETLKELKSLFSQGNFLQNRADFLQKEDFKLSFKSDSAAKTRSSISVVV